jgi:hypothetical protein
MGWQNISVTKEAYSMLFSPKSDYYYYTHILQPEQLAEESPLRHNPVLKQVDSPLIP